MQDAETLLRAASDSAAKLVQLRQAEPLRMLDDHDGGVGHVDPDFDDGRRDEDADLALAEPAHHRVALFRLESAVDQADGEVGPARGERLRHGGGGAQVRPLRLLDHRKHHIGLPTLETLRMHEIEDPVALRVAPQRRPDRAAARRLLP